MVPKPRATSYSCGTPAEITLDRLVPERKMADPHFERRRCT